jgi:hypothetical protein
VFVVSLGVFLISGRNIYCLLIPVLILTNVYLFIHYFFYFVHIFNFVYNIAFDSLTFILTTCICFSQIVTLFSVSTHTTIEYTYSYVCRLNTVNYQH